jgi:hypothetical protein
MVLMKKITQYACISEGKRSKNTIISRVGVVKTSLVNTGWFLPPNKSQKWEILGNSILLI